MSFPSSSISASASVTGSANRTVQGQGSSSLPAIAPKYLYKGTSSASRVGDEADAGLLHLPAHLCANALKPKQNTERCEAASAAPSRAVSASSLSNRRVSKIPPLDFNHIGLNRADSFSRGLPFAIDISPLDIEIDAGRAAAASSPQVSPGRFQGEITFENLLKTGRIGKILQPKPQELREFNLQNYQQLLRLNSIVLEQKLAEIKAAQDYDDCQEVEEQKQN